MLKNTKPQREVCCSNVLIVYVTKTLVGVVLYSIKRLGDIAGDGLFRPKPSSACTSLASR